MENFDWLDDLTAGVEERDARAEERRKLREDIARLDGLHTLEELADLQDRVASALAGSRAGIAMFNRIGDFNGLARAEYALGKFDRAMRRIDGRRRSLVRLAAEREAAAAKEKRRAKQLALEEKHKQERLRQEEIKREQERLRAEARVRAEEEKTRRHLAAQDRNLRIKDRTIRLIRDRRLLDEETLHGLLREAEKMVDAEDATPTAGP